MSAVSNITGAYQVPRDLSSTSPPGPAALYLAGLAPGSRPTQQSALRLIADFLWGTATRMEDCQWEHVDRAAVLSVVEFARTRYSPATARRWLAALRGTVKQAYLTQRTTFEAFSRAFEGIKIRGSRVRPGRALTPGEIEVLTRDAGIFERALILTMVGGGLRRHEAAGLREEDTIFEGHDRVRLIVKGKGNKEREVYLEGRPAYALAAYMAQYPKGSFEPVFGYSVSGLAKRLHSILSRVRATSHDLRRTYASAALERGVDLGTVQQVLGHEDPRTTAGYDRRNETAAKRAASEVNSWLNG